ncbi:MULTISPECIES: hypothetical protein [unclassified Streptomyces]|uniref:hypothetical protein n=1 Tax=unclassified Streptomyces TaxID=2593676 RepID=UPI00380E36CD
MVAKVRAQSPFRPEVSLASHSTTNRAIRERPETVVLVRPSGRPADSIRLYRLPPDGFHHVQTLGIARIQPHREDLVL